MHFSVPPVIQFRQGEHKMKNFLKTALVVLLCDMLPLAAQAQQPAAAKAHWTVVAWNDLGMHCMDKD